MAIDFFTPEEIDHLNRTTVRMTLLVEMQFVSGTKRVYIGTGNRIFGGQEWEGLGTLGSIEGLLADSGLEGMVSRKFTLRLSAVLPEWLAVALSETSEVQGQKVVVLLQLLDEGLQAVGTPIPIRFGIMQAPRITLTGLTSQAGQVRDVAIPCENLFFRRSRVPAGRWNSADQASRYPYADDKFFEWTPTLVVKAMTWPI